MAASKEDFVRVKALIIKIIYYSFPQNAIKLIW
jgi:hypothetical protein